MRDESILYLEKEKLTGDPYYSAHPKWRVDIKKKSCSVKFDDLQSPFEPYGRWFYNLKDAL